IANALRACRLRRATLIIAKLDRLARNVAFISSLMESGVDFVACDNPHATRLTIHILAAVAEHEREMISARTTAALAVLGTQLPTAAAGSRGVPARRSSGSAIPICAPAAVPPLSRRATPAAAKPTRALPTFSNISRPPGGPVVAVSAS